MRGKKHPRLRAYCSQSRALTHAADFVARLARLTKRVRGSIRGEHTLVACHLVPWNTVGANVGGGRARVAVGVVAGHARTVGVNSKSSSTALAGRSTTGSRRVGTSGVGTFYTLPIEPFLQRRSSISSVRIGFLRRKNVGMLTKHIVLPVRPIRAVQLLVLQQKHLVLR
jgi:hypothetical protein